MADVWPKLAKLLALAASDHDGEAVAAVRAAGRLLADHALDWNDVASHLTGTAKRQPEKREPQASRSRWRPMIRPVAKVGTGRFPSEWPDFAFASCSQ
jgi:hypothetical protein